LATPDDETAAMRLESAAQKAPIPSASPRLSPWPPIRPRPASMPSPTTTRRACSFARRAFSRAPTRKKTPKEIYSRIVTLDATDDIAANALMQVRRALGKFEEVIEMLLARGESAQTGEDKARAMAEIGRIYASELEDKAQALVAYTQAFCEDPNRLVCDEVERLAGSDQAAWVRGHADVRRGKRRRHAARAQDPPLHATRALVLRPRRPGRSRGGLLSGDPRHQSNHEAALAGLCAVYQKAQQWTELASMLLHRAGAAPSPATGRNLYTEAAELYENKLSDSRQGA